MEEYFKRFLENKVGRIPLKKDLYFIYQPKLWTCYYRFITSFFKKGDIQLIQ